jgi:hypothetical protein
MEIQDLRGSARFIIGRDSNDVRRLTENLKWMEGLLEEWGEFERDNLLDGIEYCKERLAVLPPEPCELCGAVS